MRLEEIEQDNADAKCVQRLKTNANAAKEHAEQMKASADTSAEQLKLKQSVCWSMRWCRRRRRRGRQEVGRRGRQFARQSILSRMKFTSELIRLTAITPVLFLCAACGTGAVYKDEAFKKESPFHRDFQRSDQQACEAAQRALLSQGYRIERSGASSVRAQKDFQPDDEVNTTIDIDVTCKASGSGSTVFANAIETSYKLKKSSNGASLNVGGSGISMPWSKSADSLVKVSGITVTDEKFYKRFFDLLGGYLNK
jgi:hypothetical protein